MGKAFIIERCCSVNNGDTFHEVVYIALTEEGCHKKFMELRQKIIEIGGEEKTSDGRPIQRWITSREVDVVN